jgi:tetratricopeptide (TPR) repeat protein
MSEAPLYRLTTLGTLTLAGPGVSIRAADHPHQRRRLALLAALAASGERGLDREQLLLLFWPDSTQKKARHSLDQLLYALRTSLNESIVVGVDPVRLNQEIIASDIGEFDRHIAAGNYPEAIALYRGPFLDTFGAKDTREFEQWVETQSRRIKGDLQNASNQIAAQPQSLPESNRVRSRFWYYVAAVGLVAAGTLAVTASRTAGNDRKVNPNRRTTANVAAYDLYVRGIDPVLLRNDSTARVGLAYLKEAVELDPRFAGAWAGLGTLYSRMAMAGMPPLPRDELQRLAINAATTAIALDDSLAEGHVVLGLINGYFALDFSLAQRELEYAIALDPEVPHAREYLAVIKIVVGRPQEALAEMRKAVVEDRHSPINRATLAMSLYALDECESALPILDSLAMMKPPLLRVAITQSLCYGAMGKWINTKNVLHDVASMKNTRALGIYGLALARIGERDSAVAIHHRLLDASHKNRATYFDASVVSFGLDDVDAALKELEQSARAGMIPWELMGPVFEKMRSDPRYARIAAAHGISVGLR